MVWYKSWKGKWQRCYPSKPSRKNQVLNFRFPGWFNIWKGRTQMMKVGHLRLMGSLESCWAKVETTRETLTSVGWLLMSTATNLSRRSGTEADKTMFVCSLSRIGNTSSHLHCMMFQTIQTIYFLWRYDPGNMSVSTYPLYSLLSWAQFTVV